MGISRRVVVVVVVDGPPRWEMAKIPHNRFIPRRAIPPELQKQQKRNARFAFLMKKTPLSSELCFATGHPKAASEDPKVAKNGESSLNFALFNPRLMPVSSEIGKSYQSI